jgi:hypothetical protein
MVTTTLFDNMPFPTMRNLLKNDEQTNNSKAARQTVKGDVGDDVEDPTPYRTVLLKQPPRQETKMIHVDHSFPLI